MVIYLKVFLLAFFIASIGGCSVDSLTNDEQKELKSELSAVESPTSDYTDIDYEIVDFNNLESDVREKLGGAQLEDRLIIVEDGGYKYILVSAGRKPTEGYSIRVGSLVGYESSIILEALLYSPGGEDIVENVATYPSLLIRIPADDREVILFLTDVRDPFFG